MDLGLAGRKAIVCASSRGLGYGCALALAQEGCELVMNARGEEQLLEAAKEIRRQTGARIKTVVADVTKPEGQRAIVAACPEPDILITNNGGPTYRDFRELSRDEMFDWLTNNMIYAIEMIQRVIDPMIENKFGRIVTISTISVYKPIYGKDMMSGGRAGLISFLAGVAQGVAKDNVTINHVLPGKFDTDRPRDSRDLKEKLENSSIEAARASRIAEIPAGRFGLPNDLGPLCAFLCSEQAGYITGQNIKVDGGLASIAL